MTIAGAQIWRGCDILARSQPPAWTPCILSFFFVCQHFQTWLPVEIHRQRDSLLGMPGSCRLYYVFSMPWMFSQQPKLLQTETSSPNPADTEAALNKSVAVIPSPSPLSPVWRKWKVILMHWSLLLLTLT